MKTCNDCGEEKPREEFFRHPETRDGLQSRCKCCMNAYNRERFADRKEYVYSIKAERGCKRCGEDDPVCLVFHHIDPKKKEFSVSQRLQQNSLDKIDREIEKCEVLCRNCHAKEHNGVS